MSNKEIINQVKRLAKLMELHGENEFKIRTLTNAVQRLERINLTLKDFSEERLLEIEGIGKSIAGLIVKTVEIGHIDELVELEKRTPQGLLELMNFRGLGTKKLALLWKDFGVTNKTELRSLINSGQLLAVKGFGEKTVKTLGEIVDFAFTCEGQIYYAEAELLGNQIIKEIREQFPKAQVSFVGKLRRKWEVMSNLEILVDQPLPKIIECLEQTEFLEQNIKKSGPFSWKGITNTKPIVEVTLYPTSPQNFLRDLLIKTGAPEHLNAEIEGSKFIDFVRKAEGDSEHKVYEEAGLEFCPPEIREGSWEIESAKNQKIPELLELDDLRGILHNHTNYSDGQNSLEEMAAACKASGFEYLGITDHSKAASFYANGLFEERVFQQQAEIDELNQKLSPFRIFKGIESDILADGSLDYDNETLKTFDFVVASIHSGLSMDKLKATERLIRAIANPYTTILGHMTGRILLQRIGYPVDHEAIINACAEFGVVIEINAHPKRLDIDWRWVHKALEKGVMLSINPDAHEIIGYDDMYYGVCVGRKGGLTKEQTLNAMNLKEITEYFMKRKASITS